MTSATGSVPRSQPPAWKLLAFGWMLFTAACGACGQLELHAGVPKCDVPLDAFVTPSGTGARVTKLQSGEDGIGGPSAQARAGDFLIENDRIRVVIQGPDRHIAAQPYGGTILDADRVREGAGRDQFGELGLLYNFGRTVDATSFEVVSDGSSGGSAVLAASGFDAPNDFLSIRNQLKNTLGGLPAVDPFQPLPLELTTYYVLAPGSQRLQVVSAICNNGADEAYLAVGDLTDPGYTVEFFNSQSCTNGFGFGGSCFGLDRMSWYGYLGEDVAYGYAPYRPSAPTVPEKQNAILTVSGVTGSILGANGLPGLLQWFDTTLAERDGELRIPGGEHRLVVRDFVVGRDLGEVASVIETSRAEVLGGTLAEVSGTVTAGGMPLANARVSVRTDSAFATVFTTDASGQYRGSLPARTYTLSAWAPNRTPSAEQRATLIPLQDTVVDFALEVPRRLRVTVQEVNGGPIPAKVTVRCEGAQCPTPDFSLNAFTDAIRDPLDASVQLIGMVDATGDTTFELPPGRYTVLVSRGPEYSVYPNDFPARPGVSVDLTSADATVNAVLARVIDTTGFMSADFHVHAVNSPDSATDNAERVLGFAVEGVDVIVSTDHDFVTDFAPYIARAGLQSHLASVIGEEISTTDFGHYNLFPLTADDSINRGALDWAGGRGPTLNLRQMFAQARELGARTIHFNHPRGFLGGFTHLKVDTDTFASHADPAEFSMARPEDATDSDTRLMSADFNALEVLNSAEDDFLWAAMYPKFNDWFTLLSRGLKVAATGVSDTHKRKAMSGGYWRTYVQTGFDTAAAFDPYAMSTALNALKASATNGPFVRVKAARVNGAGALTTPEFEPGGTVPASSDKVRVAVEVQVPEYLDVTRIELYLHKPQDDASCPIDPASPIARTTRVACDGVTNLNWPTSGITATRDVALSAANLETVASASGVSYRRYRITEVFELPAPDTDNWIVAFVYGSKSLYPLTFKAPKDGSPAKSVYPFALTNPVFVDADGGGYDRPPFNPGSSTALKQALAAEEPTQEGAIPLGASFDPTDAETRRLLAEKWALPVAPRTSPPTEAELLETFERLGSSH